MELNSHINEGVKNLILLLFPQYTKLLHVQLGKTDMGFHLLLFILSRKISSTYAHMHIANFVKFYWIILILPYAYVTNKIGGSFHDHHVVNEHRFLIINHKPTIITFLRKLCWKMMFLKYDWRKNNPEEDFRTPPVNRQWFCNIDAYFWSSWATQFIYFHFSQHTSQPTVLRIAANNYPTRL